MRRLLKTELQKSNGRSRALRLCFLLLFSQALLVPLENAAATDIGGAGPYTSQFTVADYDGDSLPDLASVRFGAGDSQATRYLIEFRLTGGLHEILSVMGPTGGLQLKSKDVNGDSFPDVVVTSLWTRQPVAVLLNDGKGNFTSSAPSAFPAVFNAAESSFRTRAPANIGGVADLFTRHLSEDCAQCGRADAPEIIARHATSYAACRFTSSDRGSFFGRAPPRSAAR